ncbi:MAG: hypothetical protein Aureis2KO_05640 [Aureisphaera sp.]
MSRTDDYNRLLELKKLIDRKQASKEEEREFIDLMYSGNRISEEQYENYMSNKNADDILQAAITIGGVLLAVWLIKKLIND